MKLSRDSGLPWPEFLESVLLAQATARRLGIPNQGLTEHVWYEWRSSVLTLERLREVGP